MNVDLLPIINNEGSKIDFEGEVKFSEFGCDVTCDVRGNVVNFAGRLDISADVKATIKTVCARCLEPLTIPMELEINETVGENDITLDGTVLDVSSVVTDNVVVELPIRFLCSEDCKGICSKCGTNLNTSKCNCKDDSIDERLAGLKSLLE